ncbi:MAG: hypothetical protein JJU02_00110 [Cryomorphaceae bacterium]|nr:hypothetical protein [Cryomorphaceae bacterium]
MISIKIEGIFEPEQVRIQKSIDEKDFGGNGLFGADSNFIEDCERGTAVGFGNVFGIGAREAKICFCLGCLLV